LLGALVYNQAMILAVDIGGTKTLLALFDSKGKICSSKRFKTSSNYRHFIKDLSAACSELLADKQVAVVACGIPARLDQAHKIGLEFGNLAWRNAPIHQDLAKILPGSGIVIENDAKLAGLAEALNYKKYRKVLYLTISTGIGDGIIISGIIDPDFADSEAGQMVLMHDGKLKKWEDFASGRAIKKIYGQLAKDITNEKVWYKYSKDLAQGIDVLVATLNPDLIIIGGGVGSHFDKFGHFLRHELKNYENNMVKMPPIVPAKHAEEAVVYGCYALAHQHLSHHPAARDIQKATAHA